MSVTAVDVNERAVLLARENAAALGVAARYVAGVPADVDPAATYDEIWSNPPIRIGKEALHELLLTWLPRLADNRVWTNAEFVEEDRLVAFPERVWTFGGPRSGEQVVDAFVAGVTG